MKKTLKTRPVPPKGLPSPQGGPTEGTTSSPIEGTASGENTVKKHRNTSGLKPPWKKGECPNPGGRPKGSGISRWYIPLLGKVDPKTRMERAQKIAEKHLDMAETNASFANIVLDRTEGAVVQKQQLSGLEDLAQLIAEGRKRAAQKDKP